MSTATLDQVPGTIIDVLKKDGNILYKVWVEHLYGKHGSSNVNPADLPWVSLIYAAGMVSSVTSPGALDIGSRIIFSKFGGTQSNGMGLIAGILHTITGSSRDMAGQTSSVTDPTLDSVPRDVRKPPDLKKTLNDQGVKIFQSIEKELFKLGDLHDIMSHGATDPLNGVRIPKISGIPTALQGAASVITDAMVAQMPGTQVSLGNMLSLLTDKQKASLFKNMPANVSGALTSILNMTQNIDTGSFGGGISGKRVDPTAFAVTIVESLKDIKSVDELLSMLRTLMTDSTLSGLGDKATFIKSSGAFGDTNIKIDGLGNITSELNDIAQKAISALGSQVSSTASSKGSLLDQVENLSSMIDRLIPENSKAMLAMISSISGSAFPKAGNWVAGGGL